MSTCPICKGSGWVQPAPKVKGLEPCECNPNRHQRSPLK